METPHLPLSADVEALLDSHGGPLAVPTRSGEAVVMRRDVYAAMLGLSGDDEAETLASVRRGVADMEAGRVQDLDDAFDELDRRYDS